MTGSGTDRSRPAIEGGPAIVLVRPQLAVNIGMCARAMANFGLTDLRLVEPREDTIGAGARRKGAHAAASGAVHVVEGARAFPSLAAAIADLNFVVATTARERGQGKPILGPEPAMADAARRVGAGERVGVVFGPERTGLENDEVALADVVVTFPVNPAYASLNLAQAVLLTGYEYFRAAHGSALPFAAPPAEPPAPRDMLVSFFDYLEDELAEAGFFRPETKRPIMSRNLRNIFHRLAMTEQDVRTLRGALVRLVEGPRREVQTRKRARPPKAAPDAPET